MVGLIQLEEMRRRSLAPDEVISNTVLNCCERGQDYKAFRWARQRIAEEVVSGAPAFTSASPRQAIPLIQHLVDREFGPAGRFAIEATSQRLHIHRGGAKLGAKYDQSCQRSS